MGHGRFDFNQHNPDPRFDDVALTAGRATAGLSEAMQDDRDENSLTN